MVGLILLLHLIPPSLSEPASGKGRRWTDITVSVLGGVVVIFLFLFVAARISYRRDLRGAAALERWAADNGWSFSPDVAGGPPWAGWSVAMIRDEVSRLLPSAELPLKDVGPVLAGVVNGTEVSLAVVRWIQGVDESGGSPVPYASSPFVAVRVPDGTPPMTVRGQPGTRKRGAGEEFTVRFRVDPEKARTRIPEALQQAHLAREVSPGTVGDGRLVSICRHQLYEAYPPVKTLSPAITRAMRAAELLTKVNA
jgi:hypothetical protein